MSGVEPDDVNRQPLRRIARSEAGKAGAGEDLTDAIGELWTKCEPKDRCFEAALAEIVDCGSKLASTIPSDRQSGDPKVFGAFLLLAERLQDADQSVEAVKESMVAFCRKCFADGPHGTHWKDAVLEALELMIDHKRGDVIKVEAFAPEERSPYLRISLVLEREEVGAFEYHAEKSAVDATKALISPAHMLRFNELVSTQVIGEIGGPTLRVPRNLLEVKRDRDLTDWGKFETALKTILADDPS